MILSVTWLMSGFRVFSVGTWLFVAQHTATNDPLCAGRLRRLVFATEQMARSGPETMCDGRGIPNAAGTAAGVSGKGVNQMFIGQDWLVIVANRQNAAFLQNQAAGSSVKLGSLHVMTLDDEASHQLGADAPEDLPVGIEAPKTYYEQTSLEQAKENRFLVQAAVNALQLFRIHEFKSVALIAESGVIGILRQEMGGIIQAAIGVEIADDHTRTAVADLEIILAAYRSQPLAAV